MLNENIKIARKAKGLSQEELAIKLNVVRQTVSKWENNLSVPDSDMLIALSEALEIPVSSLLGETISETKADDLKVIAEKLEMINLQLAQRKYRRQKIFHRLWIALSIITLVGFILIFWLNSPYLSWNYSDHETAVIGVLIHIFEWLFVRLAPLILIGAIIGAILTRTKQN